MAKNKQKPNQKSKDLKEYGGWILLGIVLLLATAAAIAVYAAIANPNGNGTYSAKNKEGYVDGQDATRVVSEFYRVYGFANTVRRTTRPSIN